MFPVAAHREFNFFRANDGRRVRIVMRIHPVESGRATFGLVEPAHNHPRWERSFIPTSRENPNGKARLSIDAHFRIFGLKQLRHQELPVRLQEVANIFADEFFPAPTERLQAGGVRVDDRAVLRQ